MNPATPLREFPLRLHHEIPVWVPAGATFHVRIRVDPTRRPDLTVPKNAAALLAAAENYHQRHRWHCYLILLMPDHLHSLLAFPSDEGLERTVGDWKSYGTRQLGIDWQGNFFDHRIRSDREFAEKWDYIMQNPVVKGLCAKPEDWPWVWHPR